jgi:hypothetical protein
MNDFKTYTISPEDRKKVISEIKSLLSKHDEVIFGYIYGSFVAPEDRYFRDIDIGLYVAEDVVSRKEFVDYSINLSLEIESMLKKFPVDVAILNNAPLSLAFRITQGELLFIRDEDLWTDFVTRIWSLYHDHAITSRNILEEIITA